jgi:hypothetical protein
MRLDHHAGVVVELRLHGPDMVRITQGESYAACSNASVPVDRCDRGVVVVTRGEQVEPLLSNTLRSLVDVCAPAEAFSTDSKYRFDSFGVRGCDIDTSVVGDYLITFRLPDPSSSSDTTARFHTATRTLRVLPSCDSPEFVCPANERLCSVDGSCGVDLAVNEFYGGESQETISDSSHPTVSLAGSLGRVVRVRQHSAYGACTAGVAPTLEYLCEPGVRAVDAEDGDLSDSVWVLPAGVDARHCLNTSCSGYEFQLHGLELAGVNTSAVPGTIFDVTFAVLDSDLNLGWAVRSVTIVDACDRGLFWCAGRCVPLECNQLGAVGVLDGDGSSSSPDSEVTIRLTGQWTDPARILVPYGGLETLPSLLPCSSTATETNGCGAVAEDVETGDDRSGELVVEQVCGDDGVVDECDSFCRPSALPLCPPGHYSFRYSLGRASVYRSIRVARMQQLTLRLRRSFNGTREAAETEVELLTSLESTKRESLLTAVASWMRTAGLEDAVVELMGVTSVQAQVDGEDDGIELLMELWTMMPVDEQVDGGGRRKLRQAELSWVEQVVDALLVDGVAELVDAEVTWSPGTITADNDEVTRAREMNQVVSRVEAVAKAVSGTMSRLEALRAVMLSGGDDLRREAALQRQLSALLTEASESANTLWVRFI